MKNLVIFLPFLSLLHANLHNEFPSIGMNGDGNSVVVWQGNDNVHPNLYIKSSIHPSGEAWGSPAPLSVDGKDSMYPKVAINNAGQMIAVWETVLNDQIAIQACTGTLEGWGMAQKISEHTNEDTFPEIDIDANGNGLLLWQKKTGGTYEVKVSRYSSDSNTWTSPVALNTPTKIMPFPEAIVSQTGQAIALWQQFIGLTCVIQTSSSTSGESWSAPVALSDPTYSCVNVQGAINSSGLAIALWQKGTETSLFIEGALCSSEGMWEETFLLSEEGIKANNPIVVMNNEGKIISIWQAASLSGGMIETIQAAVYSDGMWSATITLSDPSLSTSDPDLALNSDGQAVAVWTANGVIQAALLSTENHWSPAVPISDPTLVSCYPKAGIDATGNGIAVWQTRGSGGMTIEAAIYSAGGSWSKETIPD